MKKQNAVKAYYEINHNGTPMKIGTEYDVLIDDTDELDPAVILRSREFGDVRGFDFGQAAVKLSKMVVQRHGNAKFLYSEKLS